MAPGTVSAGPRDRPALSPYLAALAVVDRTNACDPNREVVDGQQVAKEIAYSRRMSAWLDKLYPEASEALRLAARCQHIERWVLPRADYPAGRRGYLSWRQALARHHARRAGEILQEVGYPQTLVARVQALLRKERLKRDGEAQALEDVACLVFLAHYFADFAERHEPAKVVEILRKTWGKMSAKGQEAALELTFEDDNKALIQAALAAPGADRDHATANRAS